MSLETSDEIAGFYGSQELLTKKIMKTEEVIKKIQEVKISQVQNVAKDVFQNKKLNLAAIGPFKEENKKEFEKLLSL